jgi:hypothetical protein
MLVNGMSFAGLGPPQPGVGLSLGLVQFVSVGFRLKTFKDCQVLT